MKKHLIPQNLRYLRNQMLLSMQGMANKMNMSEINVCIKKYEAYESGRNEPNIDMVKQFADFFKLSMEEFCYKDLSKN